MSASANHDLLQKTYRGVSASDGLNDELATSLLLVAEVEVDVGNGDDGENDQVAGNAGPETGLVAWLVLLSKTIRQHTVLNTSMALSTNLNTKLPAMPPIPPKATSVALQNARFHWPRMLFACQLIMCGILELAPAHVKKTPAY